MTPHHASPSSPHRTTKGAHRIEDLTNVATELFLERGFEAVAVDDLIGRVGGSRRNVYTRFGGKEGLFIECVRKLCVEIGQPLMQLDIADGESHAALEAFGRELLQIVLQPRTLALHRLMVAEGRRFPDLAQAVFHAGHSQAADVLSAWIEARQKKRRKVGSRHMPASTLARHFVSMLVMEPQLRALTGLASVPLPKQEVAHIVNEAVSTFLDGAHI